MTDRCRLFRQNVAAGRADWNDFPHVESCSACEIWLQEHVNFRSLQADPPDGIGRRGIGETCRRFLEEAGDFSVLEDTPRCPRCAEAARSLQLLGQILGAGSGPSKRLVRRLHFIASPRAPLMVRIVQVAAAILIATLLTVSQTSVGRSIISTGRGDASRRINLEISLARAYLYRIYGEARGRIALAMAGDEAPDKEEKDHAMPVSPGQ